MLCIALFFMDIGALHAAGVRPFAPGYAMASFSTLIGTDDLSARQPWLPASCYHGLPRHSFSVAATQYYDVIDPGPGPLVYEAHAGMMWARPDNIVYKMYYGYFDAFSLYYEHHAAMSLACTRLSLLSPGITATANTAGIRYGNSTSRTTLEAGASLYAHFTWCHLLLRVDDIAVYGRYPGFTHAPRFSLSLHTTPKPYGAQGVRMSLRTVEPPYLRVYAGQALRISPHIQVCAAVACDPLTIACGVLLTHSSHSAAVSLAHHPVLGWSESCMYEWIPGSIASP
jgi:hypothetical protein